MPKLADWVDRNLPLSHHGKPEDFRHAVLLVAPVAGRCITGQTIITDGGWTAR